jgi:hypothetical protein
MSLTLQILLNHPGKDLTFNKSEDAADFNELKRKLAWAYREVGYVPVESVATASRGDMRRTLYIETLEIVLRLVQRTTAFDPAEKDWVRFWTLYGKELIGVESPDFARAMVGFGTTLKKLNAERLPPDEALKTLGQSIETVAKQELTNMGVGSLK